jgi:predicted RNase H-like nuclease (RuvC/YqgF family)|tara:strand:+ start:399 stop:986 length:588 start_codon:yes stop_codon:yes gene_type:complete
MNDKLTQIAKLLPDSLSETGLQEVLKMVNEAVEERVTAEVKLMETKVSGFLRTKIADLKEVAKKEVESDDEILRGYRIFESIRAMVAAEVETSDVDSKIAQQANELAELQESLTTVNQRLSNSLHENTMLSSKVESLNETNEQLTESAKLPFKSSESAVVITNETDSSRPSREAANNIFLTEDVINLSKQEVLKD